jgi:hypothetical protein
MTLQEKLDAFKTQFESGALPYNTTQEVVQIMHALPMNCATLASLIVC